MLRTMLAAGLALLAVPAAAQTEEIEFPCGRACMERVAGNFLTALARRDVSSLPLAPGARYTENGQAMGFDNGLWRTAPLRHPELVLGPISPLSAEQALARRRAPVPCSGRCGTMGAETSSA